MTPLAWNASNIGTLGPNAKWARMKSSQLCFKEQEALCAL